MNALIWAGIFTILVHEAMRQGRRLLPGKLEAAFLRLGPGLACGLGALAYFLFPGAAPELAAGPLALPWGAAVGSMSSVGYELKKLVQAQLLKRAGAFLGGEAPQAAGDAPPLPATVTTAPYMPPVDIGAGKGDGDVG